MPTSIKKPGGAGKGQRGVGRPRKEIDLALVSQLAAIQCTDEEIAAAVGVCLETLIRRKKEPEFLEALEGGKAKGRISLRRTQWKMAQQGNATMAIFLGKNVLGQRDKPEEAGVEDVIEKARQIRDALRDMTDLEVGGQRLD